MDSSLVFVVIVAIFGRIAGAQSVDSTPNSCDGIGPLECYFCTGIGCNTGCIRGESCINITEVETTEPDKVGYISDPVKLSDGCANHTLLGREVILCSCSTHFCNGNETYVPTSTTHEPSTTPHSTTTSKPVGPTTTTRQVTTVSTTRHAETTTTERRETTTGHTGPTTTTERGQTTTTERKTTHGGSTTTPKGTTHHPHSGVENNKVAAVSILTSVAAAILARTFG